MQVNVSKLARAWNLTPPGALKRAKSLGYPVTKRGRNTMIDVPNDPSCNLFTDDDRLKKARADLAEINLADRKKELGEKYVNIFIDAFLEALPAFKQAQSELDLSPDDIKKLQDAADRLASDTVKAARRILTGGATSDESE